MPERKFTPGEWKVKIDGTLGGRWVSIYIDDKSWDGGHRELFQAEVIEVSNDGKTWVAKDDKEEIIANANLSAASKNLYEACAALVEAYEAMPDGPLGKGLMNELFHAAKNAIAKADGKEVKAHG